MKLLTPAHANAKTAKNLQHSAYQTYILHLAPAKLSGYNTCPAASAGCAAACLNSAGRGAFSSVQQARIRKTKLFFEQREEFFAQLIHDLHAVQRKATKAKKQAVVRLNGTSDIAWEAINVPGTGKNTFDLFPAIQFYDYTKILRRVKRQLATPIANYHLTFSRSESNEVEVLQAIEAGASVAIVFGSEVPTMLHGRPVVDGDAHDLRFLDGNGVIVALKAKGKAKRDESGFVFQTCSNKKTA